MQGRYFAFALLAILLCSCASNEIPQLGLIDKGRYYDAAARFACPVPAPAQGFTGPVRVIDAEVVGEGYAPASHVEFIDTVQSMRRIEISFQSITTAPDVQQAGFDAEDSGRIVIGSSTLHQLPLHYAMLQVPYKLAESARPIELHLLANFVIPLEQDAGELHVQLRDSRPAEPLLPSTADPANADAVLHALRREADSLRDIRNETFDWLRQCYWSTDSSRQ